MRSLERGPGDRRVAAEVFVALAGAFLLLARLQGAEAFVIAALGTLLAATLLVVIQAPIGGVPVGYTLLIASSELAHVTTYFIAVGFAVLATVPVLLNRYGHDDGSRRVVRWLLASAACGGAAVVMRALSPGAAPDAALLRVTVAGAAFLGVDLTCRHVLPTPTAPPMRLAEAWPVHISLLCAAGLLAVAYEKDPWMALVALVPLVMTRFAFERYAAAKQAYRQTIKALSIVPEVAGVTPLGHGERSAVYAVALARQLGFGNEAVERVATAARLHHIGYVTLDDPDEARLQPNRQMLARLGGEILRQTEFLADVGDLVENIHAPEVSSRESAVVRIATAFDHLVGEDPARALGALQLLIFREHDPFGAAAVVTLEQVLAEDPAVICRAIASGAPFTEAASASGTRLG
ncbi:MAG: hypothetical protein JO265_11500 [Acidimicrobiia bacterium]|nr:hypothetical protein [Acidimicrobiia bacterium]